MEWEKAAKKISDEVGCDMIMAVQMTEQLRNIHVDLRPVVSAWAKGGLTGFEFRGITIDTIIEKERCTYIQAVFSMSTLLNEPEFASMYLGFPFDTDYLEG
jgi:hypothetical protein